MVTSPRLAESLAGLLAPVGIRVERPGRARPGDVAHPGYGPSGSLPSGPVVSQANNFAVPGTTLGRPSPRHRGWVADLGLDRDDMAHGRCLLVRDVRERSDGGRMGRRG